MQSDFRVIRFLNRSVTVTASLWAVFLFGALTFTGCIDRKMAPPAEYSEDNVQKIRGELFPDESGVEPVNEN